MITAARIISYLFHPLLMPTIGLLLILNSGTYLSLLDAPVKRAILSVMALGTLIFPVMILPVLYYRKLITTFHENPREERLIFRLIVLVLYIITFVYFVRLPLSHVIHAFVLSTAILLFLITVLCLKYTISEHMAALGGVVGLIIRLIMVYETPLQWILILALMAAGLTGSARLMGRMQRPWEIYSGFLLGFVVVLATLMVY
jgi:hypothetical protein